MSRTYKHAPYWVLLNRFGVEEHDHTFTYRRYSGHRTYRIRLGKPVLDENGKPVMEERHEYKTAEWISKNAPRTKTYQVEVKWPESMVQSMRYTVENGSRMMSVTGRGINPIWQEAQKLVNEGNENQLMVYRTYQVVKREKHRIDLTQHCTADLPMSRSEPWGHDRPCGKEMPRSYHFPHNKGSWSVAERESERGGLRGRVKASSRRLAYAYNNGDDLYEFERDDLNMTEVDPYRLW